LPRRWPPLLSMLENIAQRLSRLWASVENLNGPPREFPIQRVVQARVLVL